LPANIELSNFYATSKTNFAIFGTQGNTCGFGERGGPIFSSTVDADAEFFGAPTVFGVPQQLGGPFANRRPCSSFVAKKKDANGNGEVWINATARGQSFSSVIFDWEYQVRFYSGDPAKNYSDATCEVGTVPGSNFFAGHPMQCNVACDSFGLGKLPNNPPGCQ
jgi:hypothetical protein